MSEEDTKDREYSTTKLFVKNLPPDTTAETLNNFFGEVGNIQRSFVVTKKGERMCSGVAYVQYFLASDALNAVQQLNGSKFFGSVISVEYAKRRNRKEKGGDKEEVQKKTF